MVKNHDIKIMSENVIRYMTHVISNWGTWGNLNLEKMRKNEKSIILKFEILPSIVP